ncbi:MAG: GGDEF domain-containing protein [Candidatus Eremiobacteraeota bacterium]|nr:GGDEF domain-containing protein [Candidatus Eremiobacteraeota bacterium]
MSDALVSASDAGALRARIAELETRLAEVESERTELAAENAELLVFQQVLSTINSSLEIDDILSIVLRGVQEALRFRRVILFDLVDSRPRRRLETNAEGLVVPARSGDFRETPALRDIIDKRLDYHLGVPGDGESPIPGSKGAYALVPLISRDIVRGVLFVEDPPNAAITDFQLRMLIDFGSQAAIAIENAQLLTETQRLAMTDPLTGLLNRRALEQMLDRELHNAERYNAHLSYIIFDLDDLKHINDTGGHGAGDEALRELADVLQNSARKGDIVARYAGDEFVIVMTNTNRSAALRGLDRIFYNLGKHAVRASAGGAIFPNDGTDAPSLFRSADTALYHAKQLGKNRYLLFDTIAAGLAQPTVP